MGEESMQVALVALISGGTAILAAVLTSWLNFRHQRRLDNLRLARSVRAAVYDHAIALPELYLELAKASLKKSYYEAHSLDPFHGRDPEVRSGYLSRELEEEANCSRLELEISQTKRALRQVISHVRALWPGAETEKLTEAFVRMRRVQIEHGLRFGETKLRKESPGFIDYSKIAMQKIVAESDKEIAEPMRALMLFIAARHHEMEARWSTRWHARVRSFVSNLKRLLLGLP